MMLKFHSESIKAQLCILGLWQEDTTAIADMKGTCMLIINFLSSLE